MEKKNNIIFYSILLIVVLAAAYFIYNAVYDGSTPGANKSGKEKAADFTVYDSSGKTVRLSDMKGKPVIVNFWASWCGPCKSELPHFDRLYNEYKDSVCFMMVDLTDGSRETESGVKSFIKQNGYTFPVYYDKSYNASDAYKIRSIPVTVAIYADGTISEQRVGSMNESILRTMVEKICG